MKIKEENTRTAPQVKICGITRIEDAAACIENGADALGFIFFPKSPRHVSDDVAKDIIRQLPGTVDKVGVFVNADFSIIMKKIETCGLTVVQLHGRESPDLVHRIMEEKIRVAKTLFSSRAPFLVDISRYDASAFLVECGKGVLPGGNAMAWHWGEARNLSPHAPLILAGGLNPENVRRAISKANPDAVDVSSGVEQGPGIKDGGKIAAFLKSVKSSAGVAQTPVFCHKNG